MRREQKKGTSPSRENFTSIDWLDVDARSAARPLFARTHRRRNSRSAELDATEGRNDEADGFLMMVGALSYCFEASQSWIAAALVGIFSGVVASAIEIATHWLTDLKLGFCSTNIFASQHFCCIQHGGAASCPTFVYWGDWLPGSRGILSEMGVYVALSTLFAFLSVWLCVEYAPSAAGSGIIELKTILSGIRIKDYLSTSVLLVKCIGLCSAVGSGLSLGKEGPFVHVGGCIGSLVGKWFPKYRASEAAARELISASAAAGVAVAFGAPIGGVLFSLEEVSYYFPHRTMIQSFFTAIISTLVLKKMDATHTGRVVLFAVSYRHEFHWFELSSFALIGILGGVIGAGINRLNGCWVRLKQRTGLRHHPIREVVVLALGTAVIDFMIPVLRGNMLETLADLFDDCAASSDVSLCHEDENIVLMELMAAAMLRAVLMAFTFGCKLPAGCFVPALFIGGCVGRSVGIWTKAVVSSQLATSELLRMSCGSDVTKCVIPGVYAIVGAAAVLAGVTRMTVCLVVIMFELTGGLEYVVPCMLVTILSKWIAELLGVPSIYEIHLSLTHYPYLNTKDEYPHGDTLLDVLPSIRRLRSAGVRAREAPIAEPHEQQHLTVFWNGMSIANVRRIVEGVEYQWFPVVEREDSSVFVGCVSRRSVAAQLVLVDSVSNDDSQMGRTSLDEETGVYFSSSYFSATAALSDPPPWQGKGTQGGGEKSKLQVSRARQLDWCSLVDSCTIHATMDMSVHKVLHVFKALGNQHIVIVEGSRIIGLLTRKDMAMWLRRYGNGSGARSDLVRWMSSMGE